MFKAIKEFFLGKPAEVATPVAPYKVPEPAAIPVVEATVEKPATIYNEKYKVEDDYPGSTRRVAETVLEVNVRDNTITTPATVHAKGSKDPRDANHDGVTSEEEKRAFALADARDTNHDGVIDAAEKSTAKKTHKQSISKTDTTTKEKAPAKTKAPKMIVVKATSKKV